MSRPAAQTALTCPSPAVREMCQFREPLTQQLGVPWFPWAPDGVGALPPRPRAWRSARRDHTRGVQGSGTHRRSRRKDTWKRETPREENTPKRTENLSPREMPRARPLFSSERPLHFSSSKLPPSGVLAVLLAESRCVSGNWAQNAIYQVSLHDRTVACSEESGRRGGAGAEGAPGRWHRVKKSRQGARPTGGEVGDGCPHCPGHGRGARTSILGILIP